MSSGPLRFLVLAVGLWICTRAAILAPGWWAGRETAPPARGHAPLARPVAAESVRSPHSAGHSVMRSLSPGQAFRFVAPVSPRHPIFAIGPGPGDAMATPDLIMTRPSSELDEWPATVAAPRRRWSVSAWALVRRERGGGAALAPGGTLGGSQAGARISYRLGGGLALSGRVYLPLRRAAGAEAAAGFDWRPVASVPVNILAERRQALGGEGRSAFALTLYGGGSRALPHRLRLDVYGQAGIVGTKARDLFADGAIRLSAPVGPIEIGTGAWGAAQPGAARLDAGPAISYRLPVRGATLRIEADWRFRIAGTAVPGSGPALTLATDF